jgi:hypothetical protein
VSSLIVALLLPLRELDGGVLNPGAWPGWGTVEVLGV